MGVMPSSLFLCSQVIHLIHPFKPLRFACSGWHGGHAGRWAGGEGRYFWRAAPPAGGRNGERLPGRATHHEVEDSAVASLDPHQGREAALLGILHKAAGSRSCQGTGVGLRPRDFAEPEEAGRSQFRCRPVDPCCAIISMISSLLLQARLCVLCCVQSNDRQAVRPRPTHFPTSTARIYLASMWRIVVVEVCPRLAPRMRSLLVHTLHRTRAVFRPPGGCCPASLCPRAWQLLAWLCLSSSQSSESRLGIGHERRGQRVRVRRSAVVDNVWITRG